MNKYENIPQELKALKRWVCWKLEKRADKNTKIPYDAKTGKPAKSNDESTWSDFDICVANLYKYSGVGFMLGNGYFGVDIDHCREKDQKAIINDICHTLKSYTEISQSGEGLHIICRGMLPQGPRRKGNIEMYDNTRYFALTGNIAQITTDEGEIVTYRNIEDRTIEIKPLWEKYINQEKQGTYTYRVERENVRFLNLTDEQVIQYARESKNGTLFTALYYGQWAGLYDSQSQADMAFCMQLAFWCNKDKAQMDRIFRSSGLYREKWDTKRGSDTYGSITLNEAINKCKDTYQGIKQDNFIYNSTTGTMQSTKEYALDDTGNAERFIDRFGVNLRYNTDNKKWMFYNGKTWVNDNSQQVKILADKMISEMKAEAIQETDEDTQIAMFKNIKHLSSSAGKEAMIKEAQHMKDTPITNAHFNRDKYLLNCDNGIIDLKVGKIIDHKREHLISKNTGISCNLDSEPTLWIKFLKSIFSENEDVIHYIQKAIGYSLTGSCKEQCLFECTGNGSNGKSVMLNILMKILGSYAVNIQVETVLAGKSTNGGNATPDIARLNGARFVRTNEPSEGSRFNEGLVKQMTGDNVMTARFLYGDLFEFEPEFKIWIACNNKIEIRGTDKGIWRRMRLIEFNKTFEGKNADLNLEDKLTEELPEILGWAVKGCLMWQEEGLEMPEDIKQATENYKQENDVIAKFLDSCVNKRTGSQEKASELYTAYKNWCKNGNEYCMTNTKFGIEMGKRLEKKQVRGAMYYQDIKLKEKDDTYVFTSK